MHAYRPRNTSHIIKLYYSVYHWQIVVRETEMSVRNVKPWVPTNRFLQHIWDVRG